MNRQGETLFLEMVRDWTDPVTVRDAPERAADVVRQCAEQLEALRGQRDLLRSALLGLVGVSTRDELEQMEVVMRLMPAPAADKAVTIDALHALLATTLES